MPVTLRQVSLLMTIYSQNLKPQKKKNPPTAPTTTSDDLRRAEAEEGGALPCLFSNNSTEGENTRFNQDPPEKILETVLALSDLLTPYRKRQAHTLYSNVSRLIEKEAVSINHVGFLTLTFPENITDPKEAYSRYRSMNTHFLSQWDEVKDWICVKERQKRGAWHYHLIVVLKGDIRSGVNFEEVAKGKYGTAGDYLRSLWKELRERLPEYGFGRSELLPVRSNAEAMGRYIGKYISKHMGNRQEEDKGVRLVNYSRGWVRNSIRFAWYSKNSMEWRRKLQKFADYVGCQEFYQLNEKLGPGWAYKYADQIRDIDKMFESFGAITPDYISTTLERIERTQEDRKAHQREKDQLLSSSANQEQHAILMKQFHTDAKQSKERSIRVLKQKTHLGQLVNRKLKISEETIERINSEIAKDREEAPLREAFQQKAAAARKTQATGGDFDQDHPCVPF